MEDFTFDTPKIPHVDEYGARCTIQAHVRFDDSCNNGHQSFAITGSTWENGREAMGGCIHDEVSRAFPELAPFIRWHLTSTDGPMHEIANACYWAKKWLGLYRVIKSQPMEDPDPKGLEHFKSTIVFGSLDSDEGFDLESLLTMPEVKAPKGIIWDEYAKSDEGKAFAGAILDARIAKWLRSRSRRLNAQFMDDMELVRTLECADKEATSCSRS